MLLQNTKKSLSTFLIQTGFAKIKCYIPWNQCIVWKHVDSSCPQILQSGCNPLIKHFASLAPSSEFIAKVVFSGKVLATLPVRIWNSVNTYLVYNSPSDSHAIKDSNINNSWHPSIIYGLRTIGPHVGTFSQVNIAGTQTTAG